MTIRTTMKAIELSLEKAGFPSQDWPISTWCLLTLEQGTYKPSARVEVYDRHTNEPDFIVPHLGKQVKWFKAYAKKKSMRGVHAF